jgi:hypothetical protein
MIDIKRLKNKRSKTIEPKYFGWVVCGIWSMFEGRRESVLKNNCSPNLSTNPCILLLLFLLFSLHYRVIVP